MIESMIECLMSEIGVDETKLLQYIEIGLKSSHHRKVFEQLLIVDNFLVFKKLMIKRNKELELEAMKELMKDEKDILPEDNEKLNLATLQAERAVPQKFRDLYLSKFLCFLGNWSCDSNERRCRGRNEKDAINGGRRFDEGPWNV